MLTINPNAKSASKNSPEKPESEWLTHRVAAIAVFVIAFVLYTNTLQHGFVMDDTGVLEQNAFVQKGIAGIPDIFINRTWEGHKQIDKTVMDFPIYRPLSLAFFAFEYEFFGLKPFGYHLMQVLYYGLLCALLYRLFAAFKLPNGRIVALVAATLFAAHPLHTEVVANIKSRDELLCLLFCVLSLYTLLKSFEEQRARPLFWRNVGFLAYLLALFCKESALTMLAVMPLTLYFFCKNIQIKQIVLPFVVYCTAAGVVLLIRMWVLTDAQNVYEFTYLDNPVLLAKSHSESIGTRLWALSEHLRLLVIPQPLVSSYYFDAIPIVSFTHWRSLLAVALYGGVVVVAIMGLMSKKPFSYCAAFFLLTLSLYSNTFYTLNNLLGERWLFVPSVAFCLTLALGGAFWAEKKRKAGADSVDAGFYYIVPALLLMFYIPQTVGRNADWKSAETLFTKDAETSPRNCLLQLNAAKTQLAKAQNEGQTDALPAAIMYFKRCLAIEPYMTEARFKLAQAYLISGKLDSATTEFEALKNKKYKNAPKEAALFLAFCYNRQNTPTRSSTQAMSLLKAMQPADWAFDPLLYNQEMGVAAHALKDYATAATSYEKAIADPSADSEDMQFLLTNLGHCYTSLDLTKAYIAYKKALKYAPQDALLQSYVNQAAVRLQNAAKQIKK